MNANKSFFIKIIQKINWLLLFPRGGFTRYPVDLFMKKVALETPNKIKVLDIGAGHKPYESLFKHCFYESCDHKTVLDKISKHEKPQHSFYCDITKEIPKPDNYYDLIICNEVVEHINEPHLAFKEFNRILRSKGKLVITAPQCHGLHQEPYNYFNFLSYGLEYLLKKSDFVNIKITPLGGIFHLLGKVLNNSISLLLERNNMISRFLIYPIELLVRILLFLFSILLFYLDYFDKSKSWTLNYSCVCEKK